jgi:hypothetical protein
MNYTKGKISVTTFINGQIYSRVFFENGELHTAIAYGEQMEKWGNEYVKNHRRHHFGIILLSRKHGDNKAEIYYEDEVAPAYMQKYNKICDSMEAFK